MSDLPIHSMTGFARVTGTASANVIFVLTIKSVNHRYLDLQFYLPGGMDALEMLLRRNIKEHVIRGHVEVRLSVHRETAATTPQYNRTVVQAYVDAFRAASREHKLRGVQPDLNAALRIPGVWSMETSRPEDEEQAGIELAAAAAMMPALDSLNAMRAQEGQALAAELERTLSRLQAHVEELASLRAGMQQAQTERLDQKMRKCWAIRSLWIGIVSCRKRRCWQSAATLKKNWRGYGRISTSFFACYARGANWGRNSISYCRR